MPARVLVADDDHALQVLLKVILSRAGYTVDFASTGREALKKATGDSYDAIMLDLILPDLSGMAVLDELQRVRPESMKRVIVVTGASRGIVDQVDRSRIRGLLRKPFDIDDILRLASECIHET